MSKLNAKLDGRQITIKASETSLDRGTVVTGVYHHRARQATFELVSDGRTMVLDRSEWEIVG